MRSHHNVSVKRSVKGTQIPQHVVWLICSEKASVLGFTAWFDEFCWWALHHLLLHPTETQWRLEGQGVKWALVFTTPAARLQGDTVSSKRFKNVPWLRNRCDKRKHKAIFCQTYVVGVWKVPHPIALKYCEIVSSNNDFLVGKETDKQVKLFCQLVCLIQQMHSSPISLNWWINFSLFP